LRKFTESIWLYVVLGAIVILCFGAIVFLPIEGYPADTPDERITRLECQVKQQREIIRYLYAQVYYPAGSKEGKLPEPKGLKKFMKGDK
jgi:hypothetical protein